MIRLYHKDDIIRSFNWLGHRQFGFTELLAIHKDYKPGKSNFRENFKKKRLPKIWYAKEPHKVIDFVSRHCKDHSCYYGINPRPGILKNERGHVRSARENDIRILTGFYFDIDCLEKGLSDEHIADIELFIAKAEGFFEDIGINPPTKAFSGRGFHLLFSPEPIAVAKHPDIKMKLIAFKDQFEQAFMKDLEKLTLRIDSTLDLRRMAKIYGTKKPDPEIKRVSRFYGGQRIIDHALRDHLMSLRVQNEDDSPSGILRYDDLPQGFRELLAKNQSFRNLWEGIGKTDGDISNSGYDFSLIRYCLKKGITDINELATILAKRPNGAFLKSGKDMVYIKRTISNAIMSC